MAGGRWKRPAVLLAASVARTTASAAVACGRWFAPASRGENQGGVFAGIQADADAVVTAVLSHDFKRCDYRMNNLVMSFESMFL